MKHICRDSSFNTPMSVLVIISFRFLARQTICFSHCFGSHSRTLTCFYFCNLLWTAKPYISWVVSNLWQIVSFLKIRGFYIAMKSVVSKAMFTCNLCTNALSPKYKNWGERCMQITVANCVLVYICLDHFAWRIIIMLRQSMIIRQIQVL